MSYNREDYKVISSTTDDNGLLISATISVCGAEFKIDRVFANDGTFHGKPTRIFEFRSLNEFVDGDINKELIEIGWNNAPRGLFEIGKELGLDYHSGASAFSMSDSRPHYIEVKT